MLAALLALAIGQALVGPVPGVRLQDEAVTQGQVTTMNFAGAGVTCSKSGATGTCTIAGGGAGSANVVQVTVVFVATGGWATPTVVTGQAWVTATSSIVCAPLYDSAISGTNNTPEVYALGQMSPVVYTRVVGTGFTLGVYSPTGLSGSFVFSCTGA